VIDLDIAKFFDTVDHHLIVKAVRGHTDQEWVVLYGSEPGSDRAVRACRQVRDIGQQTIPSRWRALIKLITRL
jgi:retron-type reverse transcriptase